MIVRGNPCRQLTVAIDLHDNCSLRPSFHSKVGQKSCSERAIVLRSTSEFGDFNLMWRHGPCLVTHDIVYLFMIIIIIELCYCSNLIEILLIALEWGCCCSIELKPLLSQLRWGWHYGVIKMGLLLFQLGWSSYFLN